MLCRLCPDKISQKSGLYLFHIVNGRFGNRPTCLSSAILLYYLSHAQVEFSQNLAPDM